MGPISFVALTLFSNSLAIPVEPENTPIRQELPIPLYQITSEKPQKQLPPLKSAYTLSGITFVSQTYNNCGPAALSMVFSHYGKAISQETLASTMRPYNNPNGGVDDKSVFPEEFVAEAKSYGYEALYRPNGTKEQVKALIANDIPVVIRTWLNPLEDIGHYRIIKGYDDEKQLFLQDDSYQGPNLTYTYDEVMSMWQPFSYAYILVYPQEKKAIVEQIIGEDNDEETAWRNASIRAKKEQKQDPQNPYPTMNLSLAYYHLGDFKNAIAAYESVREKLPSRMLWYQPEPLYAYQKIKQTDKVLNITEAIINGGNPAFSELYQLRGEIYLEKGDKTSAKNEFQTALYYNNKFATAQKALEQLL